MKCEVNKFEIIWAHLFCLFFIAQILSPYILDHTIYLEILIAIFNPYFWKWIGKIKIKYEYLIFLLSLLFFCIVGHIDTCIKLILIMFCVIYLFYLKDKKIWKLNIYIYISILIAIVQFISLFINPEITLLISSSNIANTIWGDYATPTYANYYTIFFIPRVSGLSRESGFLASLMISIIWLTHLEYKFENKGISLRKKILFFLGYILSFSKMSFVIVFIYIMDKLKKVFKYIPFWILITGIVFIITYWGLEYKDFLYDKENETFLSRFGAYLGVLDLNWWQFLFGTSEMNSISSYPIELILSYEQPLAGFGYFIIYNGFIATVIYLISLYLCLKVSTLGFLMLFLFTINVQFDTNQNFVVLTYFIVFKYYTINNSLCDLIKEKIKLKNRGKM